MFVCTIIGFKDMRHSCMFYFIFLELYLIHNIKFVDEITFNANSTIPLDTLLYDI